MKHVRNLVLLATMAIGVAACKDVTNTAQNGTPAEGSQTPQGSTSNSGGEILAAATEGGWQNVDLLVSSGDAIQASKNCVEERTGATSCYAFLTREAYEAAQPKAAGNFTLTCWAARWTRNKEGTVSGGLNNYLPPACPASSRFETPKQADEASAEPATSEPLELRLTLEPTVTGDQILLQGATNLPDGTELSTSVSGRGFTGQDKAVVKGGQWRSGPFGPRGGLEPGTYEASVTLPYGRTQAEKIQTQLGRQLEKLSGPLMETNPELEFMGQSATVKANVRVQ
ncbi:MAG TPA: hypothetical protein VGG06_10655 [Thermoanaerobaculia bacterium]|jgi:hypothetical protein